MGGYLWNTEGHLLVTAGYRLDTRGHLPDMEGHFLDTVGHLPDTGVYHSEANIYVPVMETYRVESASVFKGEQLFAYFGGHGCELYNF